MEVIFEGLGDWLGGCCNHSGKKRKASICTEAIGMERHPESTDLRHLGSKKSPLCKNSLEFVLFLTKIEDS